MAFGIGRSEAVRRFEPRVGVLSKVARFVGGAALLISQARCSSAPATSMFLEVSKKAGESWGESAKEIALMARDKGGCGVDLKDLDKPEIKAKLDPKAGELMTANGMTATQFPKDAFSRETAGMERLAVPFKFCDPFLTTGVETSSSVKDLGQTIKVSVERGRALEIDLGKFLKDGEKPVVLSSEAKVFIYAGEDRLPKVEVANGAVRIIPSQAGSHQIRVSDKDNRYEGIKLEIAVSEPAVAVVAPKPQPAAPRPAPATTAPAVAPAPVSKVPARPKGLVEQAEGMR